MFMKPGTLYVYQIYGIHFCVNVSSQGKLRLKEFQYLQHRVDTSSYTCHFAVTCELPMGPVNSRTCCHLLPLGPGFCCWEQHVTVDRQCINFGYYKQGPSPSAQQLAWWGFGPSCELFMPRKIGRSGGES